MNLQRTKKMKKKFKYLELLFSIIFLFLCGCASQTGSVTHHALEQKSVYVCTSFFDNLSFDFESKSGEDSKSPYYTASLYGNDALFYYGYYDNKPNGELLVKNDVSFKSIDIKGDTIYPIIAGSVIGTDDYLIMKYDSINMQNIVERYAKDEIWKEAIVLSDFEALYVETIIMDSNDYLHIIASDNVSSSDRTYYIYSSDGKLIFSKVFRNSSLIRLLVTNNNTLAYDCKKDVLNHQVIYIDPSTNEDHILFKYQESESNHISGINTFDGSQLIYMNEEGIFLCDYNFDNHVLIFSWEENGFSQPAYDTTDYIRINENGVIEALIGTMFHQKYIVLEKNSKEKTEISLAILGDSTFYNNAVIEYNKNNADSMIKIAKYSPGEDQTLFTTKLIAGNSPVLIDSSLINICDAAPYLESLDNFYAEEGLVEKIDKTIINLETIDNKIYGAVIDYYIDTLISSKANDGWNYSSFINAIKESKELKYISNNFWNLGKAYIATSFLDNGPQESLYFKDSQTTPDFNSASFQEVISLIDSFGDDAQPASFISGLKEETILCDRISIEGVDDYAALKELYGDMFTAVGYPCDNTSKHYLIPNHCLCISKTATEEEKNIAYNFLKYLLSEEGQTHLASSGYNFGFPVISSVVETQIDRLSKGSPINSCFTPEEYINLKKEPDKELIKNEIEILLNNSVPRYSDEDYKDILYEEFTDYYSGAISIDQLCDHLSNRICLYLKEQ